MAALCRCRVIETWNEAVIGIGWNALQLETLLKICRGGQRALLTTSERHSIRREAWRRFPCSGRRTEIMGDSGHTDGGRDLHRDIKLEPTDIPVSPQRYGVGAEEPSAAQCEEEEESCPMIYAVGCAAILIEAASEEPSAGHTLVSSKMAEDQKIWDLTLEVICLLTGETFPVTSGDHVTMAVSPPPSWTLERLNRQKILEISSKITELLMAEVSGGSPDVGVSESMEEPEPLKAHKELYTGTKMEDQPLPQSLQRSLRPLYSQDSTQESHLTPQPYQVFGGCPDVGVSLSMEEPEPLKAHKEFYTGTKMEDQPLPQSLEGHLTPQPYQVSGGCPDVGVSLSMEECEPLKAHKELYTGTKMEDQPLPQSLERSLYSQDSIHNGHLTSQQYQQTVIKEEEPMLEASGHTGVSIKMEPSSCPVTPERPPLGEDGAAIEETGVSGWIIEEESIPVIDEGCQNAKRDNVHPNISSDCRTEDDPEERIFLFSQQLQLLRHDIFYSDIEPYVSQLIAHEISHSEKNQYSCSKCGKSYSLKSSLANHERIHERVHNGEKRYSCSKCGKCYSRKASLVYHERTHNGEKPYLCSECGKCFGQQSDLIKHERIHTGEKPYSCSKCGKLYARKCDLAYHERLHTGVKPYSCSECGKSFIQRSDLKKHERIHTGVKPHPCNECGKSFNQRSHLLKHEKIHTGEKPCSCFKEKSCLVSYEEIHTGQKPHPCSECGKSFNEESLLVAHERTHTGEKPHSCSDCGKCFNE